MKKSAQNDKQPVIVEAITKDLQINAVHVNVAQEYIMITEDKTYRCLSEWKANLQTRDSWIAPVSLLASLVLAFVTADFRDTFGVPKDTWRALFIIGAICSAAWTVKALVALWRVGKGASVDELIVQLKKGAVVQKATVDTVKAEATITEKASIVPVSSSE